MCVAVDIDSRCVRIERIEMSFFSFLFWNVTLLYADVNMVATKNNSQEVEGFIHYSYKWRQFIFHAVISAWQTTINLNRTVYTILSIYISVCIVNCAVFDLCQTTERTNERKISKDKHTHEQTRRASEAKKIKKIKIFRNWENELSTQIKCMYIYCILDVWGKIFLFDFILQFKFVCLSR